MVFDIAGNGMIYGSIIMRLMIARHCSPAAWRDDNDQALAGEAVDLYRQASTFPQFGLPHF